MASYPTILPDSVVQADAAQQLQTWVGYLGDPTVQYATDQLQKFANSLPDLGSFLKPQPDTSPAASEQTAAIGQTASPPVTPDVAGTSGATTGTDAVSAPEAPPAVQADTTTPSTTADSVAQLQKFAETLGDPTAKFQSTDQTPTQPLASPAIPSPQPSTPVPTTQLSPDTTPTIAPPSPPAAAPPVPPTAAAATPRATGLPAAGDIAGWRQVIAQQVSPELAKVPQFIDTVLAGALAESGLNPSSVQQGGGGRGFFQFDVGGGMGTGLGPQQLFSEPFQASRIIPAYEAAWKAAPANLSPADKAAWVAVQAERPDDRLGQASARYRNAFATVSGTPQGLPRLYTPEQISAASTSPTPLSAPPAQPPAAPFSLANVGNAVGKFGLGAVQGASSLARGELAREANAQPISPTDYLTRGVLAGTDLYGQAVQKHLADVNAVEAMPEGPAKRDALFQLSQAGVMGVTGTQDVAATGPIQKLTEVTNELLAPVRNTAPEVQTAVLNWANGVNRATTDADSWGRQGKVMLGSADTAAGASNYEHNFDFSTNPTQPQTDFAAKWQDYAQQTGDLGRQHGYITGDPVAAGQVNAYFPHLYEDTVPSVNSVAIGGRSLNPKDFYSRSRIYPSLADAVAGGKTPVNSVSQPIANYVQRIQRSEANYQLIQDLKNASPAAVAPMPASGSLPDGWRSAVTTDPQFRGLMFPEPVARVIDNITGSSAYQGTQVGRAAMQLAGTAKSTLFSLSGFHLRTELVQSLLANGVRGIPVAAKSIWYAVHGPAYDAWRVQPDTIQSFSEAAGDGVTGLVGREGPDVGQAVQNPLLRAGAQSLAGAVTGGSLGYETAAQGQNPDPQTLRDRALTGALIGAVAGPTVGSVLNAGLWERAIPTMKVLTYEIAKQSSGDGRAAATFTNQTYGGQNLAQIARSPTVQGTMRLVGLAPDWWEGWIRQAGGAFNTGPIGNMSRAYWARAAVLYGATMLAGLNYALNGHTSDQNDPGHYGDLETTGLYDKMGWPHNDTNGQPVRTYAEVLPSPIRDLINSVSDPTGNAALATAGNLAGLVPHAAAATLTGVDWRGRPISPPGATAGEKIVNTARYLGSQVAPVGLQSLGQSQQRAVPAALVAATTPLGIRLMQQSNATQRYPMQATALPQSSQDIIRQYHLNWYPQPPPRQLGGVDLHQPEVDRWQTLYLQQLDTNLHVLADDSTFTKGQTTDRNTAFNRAETRARKFADGTIIEQMGSDYDRRKAEYNAAQPTPAP